MADAMKTLRQDATFQRESEMTETAINWLMKAGLTVKSEFVTPWGTCDLVGLKFNQDRIRHRLSLQQKRFLGSITRSLLLTEIPEHTDEKRITIEALTAQFCPSLPADTIAKEISKLIEDRFVVSSSEGQLHRVSDWLPLQDRLVAIELKLNRVEEALNQARNNLGFADESFVAFPMRLAKQIAANTSRWEEFFANGIGLIGVLRGRCRVLIPAYRQATAPRIEAAVQTYCVEKFFRTRFKSN